MKTLFILSTLLFCQLSWAKTQTVEFEISEINSANGKLYIQLFKGKDNFSKGVALSLQIIPAIKGNTKLRFPNLTPGEYAVRFFHDEDNDGKMSTNAFGRPIEGYGFSNNAKPVMGPPSYQDAKFTISQHDITVVNASQVIY